MNHLASFLLRCLRSVCVTAALLSLPLRAQTHADADGAQPPTAAAGGGDRAGGRDAGLTFEATLPHGAYRVQGAPSVVVHVPPGFDPAPPLRLVVFLHGYMNCARAMVASEPTACRDGDPPREGRAIARHHDEAGTNSVLVVPQLAFLKRDGRAGCFARRGCFDAFLNELLGVLAPRLGVQRIAPKDVRLTLVAHSAGYKAALAILERSAAAARVEHVALLDALYNGAPQFARFLSRAAARGASMLSIHLNAGATGRGSRDLLRRMQRVLGASRVAEVGADEIAQALADHTLVVAEGHGPHRLVPAHHLAELLRAWLPAR